jgi:hypothetical protein
MLGEGKRKRNAHTLLVGIKAIAPDWKSASKQNIYVYICIAFIYMCHTHVYIYVCVCVLNIKWGLVGKGNSLISIKNGEEKVG